MCSIVSNDVALPRAAVCSRCFDDVVLPVDGPGALFGTPINGPVAVVSIDGHFDDVALPVDGPGALFGTPIEGPVAVAFVLMMWRFLLTGQMRCLELQSTPDGFQQRNTAIHFATTTHRWVPKANTRSQ